MCNWFASLFLHMQNTGFLMNWRRGFFSCFIQMSLRSSAFIQVRLKQACSDSQARQRLGIWKRHFTVEQPSRKELIGQQMCRLIWSCCLHTFSSSYTLFSLYADDFILFWCIFVTILIYWYKTYLESKLFL